MSSKIIVSGESAGIEPLLWRAAGAVNPATAAPEVAMAQGPEPASDLERLQAEWRQEIERRVAEARQAGRSEGEAAARRAAEADLRPVIERLARSIEEIANLRPAALVQAEANLLKLALAIARRVLHRELSIDPEAVEGLVRVALEKVRVEEVRRVRVDARHAAALKAALERLPGARGIEVQVDSQLEPGGVILETGRGNLDASVDTQLAEIERGLADRLRRRA